MGIWDWVTSHWGAQESENQAATQGGWRSAGSAPARQTDGGGTAVLEAPGSPESALDRWWAPPSGDLRELSEPERPDLCAEGRALENLLIMHFDGRNLSLPALPQGPERVLRLLSDPDCGLGRVAEEIGKDPVSAATVIRMSNSSLYGGLTKITAIQPAVVRLGASVVRTVMYNLSLRSVMFSERHQDGHFAEMLWCRALAGGIVMRRLSSFTRLNPEEAFLIGLLHDVGNIIVLRIVNSQRAILKVDIDRETFEYLCHESHQEFGELLADAWGMPPRLKALISGHHGACGPDDPYRAERLQLELADIICSLQNYLPYAAVNLLESNAARELGVAERSEFQAMLPLLPDELDRAIAELA